MTTTYKTSDNKWYEVTECAAYFMGWGEYIPGLYIVEVTPNVKNGLECATSDLQNLHQIKDAKDFEDFLNTCEYNDDAAFLDTVYFE